MVLVFNAYDSKIEEDGFVLDVVYYLIGENALLEDDVFDISADGLAEGSANCFFEEGSLLWPPLNAV